MPKTFPPQGTLGMVNRQGDTGSCQSPVRSDRWGFSRREVRLLIKKPIGKRKREKGGVQKRADGEIPEPRKPQRVVEANISKPSNPATRSLGPYRKQGRGTPFRGKPQRQPYGGPNSCFRPQKDPLKQSSEQDNGRTH